jgi:hypothetical protein
VESGDGGTPEAEFDPRNPVVAFNSAGLYSNIPTLFYSNSQNNRLACNPVRYFQVMHPRLEVVQILHEAGITSCLWSEDALAFYNVPTVVFELYLLVPDGDLEKASSTIACSPGYKHVPPDDDEMRLNLPRQHFLQYWSHRFIAPWYDGTGVQLLPAERFAQFNICPETTVRMGSLVYPKMTEFIESLVCQYLRSAKTRPEIAYRSHLAMHICYLGDYAPDRHEVLQYLSPKARRLWKDVLDGTVCFGEAGFEHYSKESQ